MTKFQIHAEWDEEALVWVATSDEVPGLATGAHTLETLIDKLKIVIPELLEENELLPESGLDIEFAVNAERTEHTRRAA